MKTFQRVRRTCRVAAGGLSLLILTIGPSFAAVPPSMAYHFSSHPMISGTVVTVNDHQMVVNTDQGEQVALELDSRTLAPRDLAPGMIMRTEFVALEDCRFYAQRIMAVRGGASTERFQAYANTNEVDDAMARSATPSATYRSADQPRVSGAQTVGPHSPGRVMLATPSTAAYQFSTRSMLSGQVMSVNDHRLLLRTDQGQQVGLVMDSHTMVPGEVAPGGFVRAEFSPMHDGRYYAKRVSRIDNQVAEREQAYAHTRDSDLLLAASPADCGFMSAAAPGAVTSAIERREPVVKDVPAVVLTSVAAPAAAAPEVLPQTASGQPLILLLSLIALGVAGAITMLRGMVTSRRLS